MKTKRIVGIILIILSATLIFLGCGEKERENPKIQVEMENGDIFIIELYPEYAPETVKNFEKLVKEGFYDGLIFHRVYEGFMAQGGGYNVGDYLFETGNKKPADSIKGEFAENGYSKNTLKHTRGVISMARTQVMDSASSEFFIMYDSNVGLDNKYAAFGKVIEGMEAVDKFLEGEKWIGMDDIPTHPVEPIIIKKMTVIN